MINEITLFNTSNVLSSVEPVYNNGTVWLTLAQLSTLYGRDVKNIGKHIKNLFEEGELLQPESVAFFPITQEVQGRIITRVTEYYNLNVILALGFRIASNNGSQFRKWATQLLKDDLLKAYELQPTMNPVDILDKKVSRVKGMDLKLNCAQLPEKGIFYDGQIFDAHTLIGGKIKKAKFQMLFVGKLSEGQIITQLAKGKEGLHTVLWARNEDANSLGEMVKQLNTSDSEMFKLQEVIAP